ncbi:hypothetical protein NDU88_008392 [Pleurodeles waltl]|uniref:Uncharacterized protein n=1 Tax=Pleurodeles waltl TaxID=8319 RepID=A0AAV7QNK9_PLEWA|nr:hypothetical protein NDU88_008392 [Pleurodeles waltl]
MPPMARSTTASKPLQCTPPAPPDSQHCLGNHSSQRLPPDTWKGCLQARVVAEPPGFMTGQPCWLAPPRIYIF